MMDYQVVYKTTGGKQMQRTTTADSKQQAKLKIMRQQANTIYPVKEIVQILEFRGKSHGS